MATPPPHAAAYHPAGTPDLPEEHSATKHVSLRTYLVVFVLLMILRPQGIVGRSTDRRMNLGSLRELATSRRGGGGDE